MKYDNVRVGMNSRLDAVQAAVLRAKLAAFSAEVDAVNERAQWYGELLADAEGELGLQLPCVPEGFRSSWAQYTVVLPESFNRDALQAKLKERDIPTMVYYPKPMHEQEAFADACLTTSGACPTTKSLCQRVLSLPMGPYLSQADIERVAAALGSML